MGKLRTLLMSLGFGAGLMYFLDPNDGARRRALVRDRVHRITNSADEALNKGERDLRNRIRGVLAEAMGRVSEDGTPDWLIEERVRAELGRFSRHAGAVQVHSQDGRVTLRGPALASEAETLVRSAGRARGVREVQNELRLHENAGDIPALQGRGQVAGTGYWTPAERLIGTAGGGLMTLYGLARRGLIGTAASLAGLGLIARSLSNTDLRSLAGLSSQRETISVQKTITIEAPADRLYQFWLNFENFPRFMAHVRQVKNLGNGRSHWVVAGPAGVDVEWDAVITEQKPNKSISWESVAGEDVKSAGTVQFEPTGEGVTRLTVRMGYTPPAGALGHAVASLFGKNPKQAMDDDLNRLKSLFEEGKTTVGSREMTTEDLNRASS